MKNLLPVVLLQLLVGSTGMPMYDHAVKRSAPATPMLTVESSCGSPDGPITAFTYPCIRRAAADALQDTMMAICDAQSPDFVTNYNLTVELNLTDSDNIATNVLSKLALLYKLSKLQLDASLSNDFTTNSIDQIHGIPKKLDDANISDDIVSHCQLSLSSSNETLQATLESHYNDEEVKQVMWGEWVCRSGFECDLKELACDLWTTFGEWAQE